MTLFPKVFWDFRKWTFIFVHFLLSEKGFGAKNRIFAMLVGTFGSHKTRPTKIYIFFEGLKENITYLNSKC